MNKYNLGDEVFTLLANKIQRVTIQTVDIHIRHFGISITYTVDRCCGTTGSISQCELFSSKQELLETL